MVRLTHFDFFCNAANEIKLALDYALFASYMMVSFAREEVFASLQYFKHVKSHSNQHSHDIL